MNSTSEPTNQIADHSDKVYFANTALQPLDQHLYAVGYVAQQLYMHFYPEQEVISQSVFVAGCLHDIGKLDPQFQAWVIKPKNRDNIPEDGQHIDKPKNHFEDHPRHNEISVLIYELLDDRSLKAINTTNKRAIKHVIYWHHAKPFRKEDSFDTYGYIYKKLENNLKDNACTKIIAKSLNLLSALCKIDCEYRDKEASYLGQCYTHEFDTDKYHDIEDKQLPRYKQYRDSNDLTTYRESVETNAVNNLIRACVITADRWVSALPAQELEKAIKDKTLKDFANNQLAMHTYTNDNLVNEISTFIEGFDADKRTLKQAEVAQKLAEDNQHIKVLSGAAGCGKTKIALEWAQLQNAQQILWICPRVQICQGLFRLLTESLPNANIELHTGEFKYTNSEDKITSEAEYFKGDIVITTIDQILSTIISHSKVDRLINYLSAHIVFDEYHEFINMPGFNLLFPELVATRRELGGGRNILAVSATPHNIYIESMLDVDIEYDIVEMPTFSNSKFQFQFCPFDDTEDGQLNPLHQPQDGRTLVISNTALTAQKSFIKNQQNENALLFHSKYKRSDKKQLFQKVMAAFKEGSNGQYDVLRSGPIVQASLNISGDNMVSEATTAENTLQRLGRLDRFGINQHINQYMVAAPQSLSKGKGASAAFLSKTYSLQSAKAWLNYLQQATDKGEKVLSLTEIYDLYKNFYKDDSNYKAIEIDLLEAIKAGVKLIKSKVSQPQISVKPKNADKQKIKISYNSLRGDNRFVQMALCSVSESNQLTFGSEYAIDTSVEDIDFITESLSRLREKGLMDYAAQKQGRIDQNGELDKIPTSKTTARKKLLENRARTPQNPIYISFTSKDLQQKLGENRPYSEAIYYAVCDKQPIGAISRKYLLNNQED